MIILLDHYPIPERGPVQITIQENFEIHVTAAEARRQVDRWLVDQVSYMMTAEMPLLVLDKRPVWRVPVVLTASHLGKVGQVGTVDVDVQTGQMDDSAEQITALQQRGVALGKQLAPYQPGRQLPDGYWANDVQPTRPSRAKQPSNTTPITIPVL